MKWLSNTYDPTKEDAIQAVCRDIGETQQEAWKRQQDWLKGKVIGEPKATESFTVEELKRVDLVGVYSLEEKVLKS